ncbi:MAG TPA: zinc ABC transporter substrate-binding protein [Alphaproteobacteria bacterium]|nr:zinc ABC transporter substrate-binding protein [Alphaproteobacteria bacterium]
MRYFLLLLSFLTLKGYCEPFNVLVSFKPIHSLVIALTEGVLEPDLLIQEDVSAHTYTLKPSHIKKLEKATLIIWVGPSYESHMANLMATQKGRIYALQDTPGIDLRPARFHHHDHNHEGTCSCESELDGHFWLSPKRAILCAQYLKNILCEKDPDHKDTYQANYKKLLNDLTALDKTVQAILLTVSEQTYVMGHDSLQYLELDYVGPKCVDVLNLGVSGQKGLKSQEKLLKALKSKEAKAVFFETHDIPSSWKEWLMTKKIAYGTLDYLSIGKKPSKDLYEQIVLSMCQILKETLS